MMNTKKKMSRGDSAVRQTRVAARTPCTPKTEANIGSSFKINILGNESALNG
jgi:hypothetical protein